MKFRYLFSFSPGDTLQYYPTGARDWSYDGFTAYAAGVSIGPRPYDVAWPAEKYNRSNTANFTIYRTENALEDQVKPYGSEERLQPDVCSCTCTCGVGAQMSVTSAGDILGQFAAAGLQFVRSIPSLKSDDRPVLEVTATPPGTADSFTAEVVDSSNSSSLSAAYNFSRTGYATDERLKFFVPIEAPSNKSGVVSVDLILKSGSSTKILSNVGIIADFDREEDRGFGAGWNMIGLDQLHQVTIPNEPDKIVWRRSQDERFYVLKETAVNSGVFAADGNDPFAHTVTSHGLPAGTALRLTSKHGDYADFASDGYIQKRTDTFGNEVVYQWSTTAPKRLEGVTSSLQPGVSISLAYQANKVVVTETGVGGSDREYELRFEGGELTKVVYPEPATSETSPEVGFGYDHRGMQITDADGNTTKYKYDEAGDVITIEHPDGATEKIIPPRVRSPLVLHRSLNDSDFAGGTRPVYPPLTFLQYGPLPDNDPLAKEYKSGSIHALVPTGLPSNGPRDLTLAVDKFGLRKGVHIDERGYETNFWVDENGYVTHVRDAHGSEWVTRRNDAGLIVTSVLPRSPGVGAITTSYGYDSKFNQIYTIYPTGASETTFYDSRFNIPILHISATETLSTNVLDPNNGAVTQSKFHGYYGLSDPPITSTMQYLSNGLLERTIDPNGNITKFNRNNQGWIEQTIHAGLVLGDADDEVTDVLQFTPFGIPTIVRDAEDRTTIMEYDDLDRIRKITPPDPDNGGLGQNGHDELSPEQVFVYSGHGDLKFHYLKYGAATLQTSSWTYDSRHRTKQATTWIGTSISKTEYDYDKAGNLTEIRPPLAHTSPGDEHITNFVYDALNRATHHILPDPDDGDSTVGRSVYTTAYDAIGWVRETTDAKSNSTNYGYNRLGQLAYVSGPKGTGGFFDYDASGRLWSSSDGEWRSTDYIYDYFGRQVGAASPATDSGTSMTVAVLDNAGNTRYVIEGYQDAANRRTKEFTYDHRHRVQTEIDELGETTLYTYDDVGNLKTLTDPEGNKTTWYYDNLNRVEREQHHPTSSSRFYVYDIYGRLQKQTDRDNRVTEYTYDNFHQLDKEIWKNGSTTVRTIDYDFNVGGQLTKVSDPSATYDYTYDGMGRQTNYKVDMAALGVPGAANGDVQFHSSYDANSMLESNKALIAYTSSGELFENYTNHYTYDGANRVKTILQGNEGSTTTNWVRDKFVEFEYNNASQLTKITRKSNEADTWVNSKSDYAYDSAGRLATLDHRNYYTSNNQVTGYAWEYDTLNQFTAMTFTNDTYDDETTGYTYDLRGQLKAADRDVGTDESYSYDGNGNRTNNGGTYQTIVAGNRLTFDGEFTYTYDNEGNRTSRSKYGQHIDYVWDHRNRLTEVITRPYAGGTPTKTVTHEYDAFDQWIHRTVDGTDHTFFVHNNGQIELEFEGTNTTADLSHRYLWGPGTDQLLSMDDGVTSMWSQGTTYWAYTDHLGTVRDWGNYSNGNIASHNEYDSFGNQLSTGAVDSLFGYTARPFDDETQLQNNLHRWYDAEMGRWLSEDPIGFAAGDANLYRYVGNSSTNATDPDGLKANWHHLLARRGSKLGELFASYGLDVDAAEFGWIIDSNYHLAAKKGTPGGKCLHPDFTREWQKFFKNLQVPSGLTTDEANKIARFKIKQHLKVLKKNYAHILKNGVQAQMSYGDWQDWLKLLRETGAKAKKNGSATLTVSKASGKWAVARRWFGRTAKGAVVLTFVYNATCNDVSVAAEGVTRDALWPLVDIAEEAGVIAGDIFDAKAESGRLERRRMETLFNNVHGNPNTVPIPGRPRN